MNSSQQSRIASVDILRGLVMIIMALDHVRDFFLFDGMSVNPLDLQTTTPSLFFSRWITHFCAPVFVFLSGISASVATRAGQKTGAAWLLVKRGLWLMLVEVTVITFGLTFNPFFNLVILQVIWVIGLSMIILGVLSGSSKTIILITGLILVLGHDALQYVHLPVSGIAGNLWLALFTSRGAVVPLGPNHLLGVFYALLPWTGIMLVGYSTGGWFQAQYAVEKRKHNLFMAGAGITLLFILLRFLNRYGEPVPWAVQHRAFYSLLSFINTSKYPPSLQYVCMTIGPALLFLSVADSMQNRASAVLTTYGRVPFFYYVLHFYLIHIVLIILFFVSGYTQHDIITPNLPFFFRPLHFGYPLYMVCVIWLSIVAVLYKPCVWFWKYKNAHRPQWWTRYV